jgi:hypothetical protein
MCPGAAVRGIALLRWKKPEKRIGSNFSIMGRRDLLFPEHNPKLKKN